MKTVFHLDLFHSFNNPCMDMQSYNEYTYVFVSVLKNYLYWEGEVAPSRSVGISIGGLGIDLLAPPDPLIGGDSGTPAITPAGKNRGNNLQTKN